MNTVISINEKTPDEVAREIADRVKMRRLELNLTQAGLCSRAGIKYATYRKFEQTGVISLKGLLQVAFALNALKDFENLFSQRQYESIDDVLAEQTFNRKRGSRNE